MNRMNFSDALPQLSERHLLLATALTTRSRRKEAALAELHGKGCELQEKFLLAYPKWGMLPDFPQKGWAQHLPVGMFSSFPFPLFLDHIPTCPVLPLHYDGVEGIKLRQKSA